MSAPSPLRWMPAPLDVVVTDAPAEQDAPALVPPTLEEIQAIQDAAYREGLERGLAEGHAEGFGQGQAEVRRLAAQMEGILDNFSRPLDRLENEVVAALSELAVRIAGALVGPFSEPPMSQVVRIHEYGTADVLRIDDIDGGSFTSCQKF